MKTLLVAAVLAAAFPIAGCVAEPALSLPHNHPAHADAETPPLRSRVTALDAPAHEVQHAAAEHQGHAPAASTEAAKHDHAASHQHAPSAQQGTDAPKPHEAHNEHKHEAAAGATPTALDKFFTAYLSAAELLAKDDFDGAAKQFDTIHRAGHRLGDSDNEKVADLGDRIGRAAHKQPEDIKGLRASFKVISPMVIELMRVAPPSPKVAPVVREAYCPMAKAPWLQTGEKVANPYFGAEMPNCGSITQTTHTAKSSHK